MKAQLERLLTRIPMYLLVNGGLCLLAVIALIYSSLGLTGFGPLELAVTSLLFTGASIGTSYLFGKLLRIHTHLQSSLISGLILALIFTPTFDLITLAQYVVIAVIAMASKFVATPVAAMYSTRLRLAPSSVHCCYSNSPRGGSVHQRL